MGSIWETKYKWFFSNSFAQFQSSGSQCREMNSLPPLSRGMEHNEVLVQAEVPGRTAELSKPDGEGCKVWNESHVADDVIVLLKASKTHARWNALREYSLIFTQTLLEAVQTADKTANFIFTVSPDLVKMSIRAGI